MGKTDLEKGSGISVNSSSGYLASDLEQELDFIIQKNDAIVTLGVKAEENLRVKFLLRLFVKKHPDTIGMIERNCMSDSSAMGCLFFALYTEEIPERVYL